MNMLLKANQDNIDYVQSRQSEMHKLQANFDKDLDAKFEAAVAELRLQRDAASKAHHISLSKAYGALNDEENGL